MDAKKVKDELIGAGIEVYRTRQSEIHIAERVRLHIMDSGVRLTLGEPLQVSFTARSQQSDFPNVDEGSLLEKVRHCVGQDALARGYVELSSGRVEVTDPSDKQRVLDVWHEVTYAKPAPDTKAAIHEIQWALTIERFVSPSS